MSRQEVLASLPTGRRKKFSLPVLAECAFAVGQGGIRQWEDDAAVLVISPLLDPRLMVSHIISYIVCFAGQVVSSRDPFHATCIY